MLVCKIIFSLFDNFLVFGCVCVWGGRHKAEIRTEMQTKFVSTHLHLQTLEAVRLNPVAEINKIFKII